MQPVLAAWLALSLLAGTGAEDTCGNPSISIPAPQLSSEERLSPHMPESLRCDACRAIAFQMDTPILRPKKPFGDRKNPCSYSRTHRPVLKGFSCQSIEEQLHRAEGKVGKKALSESDYTEVLERSCSQGWESYGVQELDGEKRLAGPGLPRQEPMTVMVTGGPWPSRLAKMCHGYVGERGEAQIYGAHRQGAAALRELLCHGEKGACAGGKAGGTAPRKATQNEL